MYKRKTVTEIISEAHNAAAEGIFPEHSRYLAEHNHTQHHEETHQATPFICNLFVAEYALRDEIDTLHTEIELLPMTHNDIDRLKNVTGYLTSQVEALQFYRHTLMSDILFQEKKIVFGEYDLLEDWQFSGLLGSESQIRIWEEELHMGAGLDKHNLH
jgi:hypothetical protein